MPQQHFRAIEYVRGGSREWNMEWNGSWTGGQGCWLGAWHVRFQIIVPHFVVIGSRSYSLSDIICTRLP